MYCYIEHGSQSAMIHDMYSHIHIFVHKNWIMNYDGYYHCWHHFDFQHKNVWWIYNEFRLDEKRITSKGLHISINDCKSQIIYVHIEYQAWFIHWLQIALMTNLVILGDMINTLRPSDAIWRRRSYSTLIQVMACWLMASSHNLKQCWYHQQGHVTFRALL